MNVKILCLLISGLMLTGCMSSKLDRLHSTTTQLSTDMDTFVGISDKSNKLNNLSVLMDQKEALSDHLIPSENQTEIERIQQSENSFSQIYEIVHRKQKRNEDFKKQSIALAAYFKKLTLLVEKKNPDVTGLVKNIDILNQVIEKNLSDKDKLEGRLSDTQVDVISKPIMSGFRAYQYHIFKKSFKEQYPVIMNALLDQKVYFRENYISATDDLNSIYFKSFNQLKEAYVAQYLKLSEEAARTGKDVEGVYSDEEFKKFEALVQQPYKKMTVNDIQKPLPLQPSQQSQAYKEYCGEAMNPKMQKMIEERQARAVKKNSAFLTKNYSLTEDGTITEGEGFFDIEQQYQNTGEALICELINVVGLMNENRFDHIELSALEKYMAEYSLLLEFVTKQYEPKKEEK